MTRYTPILLGAACLLAGLGVSVVADRLARSGAGRGDSGPYWATMAYRTCCFLAVPALLSVAAETNAAWWRSGIHLQFDRVLGSTSAFPLALVMPFVVWAAMLLVPPQPAELAVSRGFAGSIGRRGVRRWVLHALWIPLVALVLGALRLGIGADAYPAFTWSTLGVLAISLIQLGRSAPAAGPLRDTPSSSKPATAAAAPLPAWPEAMRAHGIALESLAVWQPPESPQPPVHDNNDVRAFEAALRDMGASEVAIEVVEAVARLVGPVADGERSSLTALVFGPDDCGQMEAVALAAARIRERQKQATLVIAPRRQPLEDFGPSPFILLLERWLDACDGGEVQVLRPGNDTPAADKDFWIVDAHTLSDNFLERLTDEAVARRIGLVVWWDVHVYTGVLAANVWAISRRLNRLLTVRGTPGVRTLVLARESTHGAAQLEAFIRRLFPYEFAPEARVRVQRKVVRQVNLHRLTGHQERFTRDDSVPERFRHLPLIATLVSAEQGWPTYFELPPDVMEVERNAVFDAHTAGVRVRQRLAARAAEGGASVRRIADGDVLSITEIVGQGGRGAPAGLPHHAAITLSENPFVAHLIGVLASRPAPTSRRLVGAESHSSIVERHLQAALRELEDTRSGLVGTFLWQETVIQRKLDELDRGDALRHEEVRFLDEGGTRRIDYLYWSRTRKEKEPEGPLDTVHTRLVTVREPATAQHVASERMKVDRERVMIQAYPGRVFMDRGWRYRVHDWSDPGPPRGPEPTCVVDENFALTWRIRAPRVIRMAALPGSGIVGIRSAGGVLLRRLALEVAYQEEVQGVLRLERDLTTGTTRLNTTRWQRPRVTEPFTTRALALLFLPPPSFPALLSLCLALRCVLPVLVGVEDDALEVVPLLGRNLDDRDLHGVAVVDLYPDGIGLVDAFQDDERLIAQVLEAARDWLAEVVGGDAGAMGALLRSPYAIAVPTEHDVRGAASLLSRVMGPPPVAPPAKATGRR